MLRFHIECTQFAGASCGTGDPSPTIKMLDFFVFLKCNSPKMFVKIRRVTHFRGDPVCYLNI